MRVAQIVDIEELRGHAKATVMTLALLAVYSHAHHGKTTGIERGPRTWPPAQVTASGSSSRYSGMRASHSSMDTRISMRARFDPAQRWMPAPNAMCGFSARSIITLSASGDLSGSRLAAGNDIRTLSPADILHPAYSTSSATTLAIVTGE